MRGIGVTGLAESGVLLAQAEQKERFVDAAMTVFDDRSYIFRNDAGARDYRTWLFDHASGQAVTPPFRHPDAIRWAALSANSRLVLTACADRTVRLWDIAPDDRPVADLLGAAELATGQRADDTGHFEPLPPGAKPGPKNYDEYAKQQQQQQKQSLKGSGYPGAK